jgi:tRNA(Ile)-lysidine synthase
VDRDADAPIGDDELDGLFGPLRGRLAALAVSGGVDSMVLLHLAARWAHRRQEPHEIVQADQTGIAPAVGLPHHPPALASRASWLSNPAQTSPPIVVLTVDHGLRPGSAMEAAFVAETAASLALPHQTLTWQHPASGMSDPPGAAGSSTAHPPATGVQRKARTARYGLMADAIEDELWIRFLGGDARCHPLSGSTVRRMIVTAHHREDLVETFLMRLQRGSGLDGLAAMRPIETFHRPPTPARRYPSTIDIARPLLDVPRARLRATAEAAGLEWKEDPSNDDLHYERIRLRAAKPAMAELGFETRALHRTIRRLRTTREAFESECRRWIDGAVDMHAGLFAEIVLRDPHRPPETPAPACEPPTQVLVSLLAHGIGTFGGGHPAPELSRLEALAAHILADTRTNQSQERTLGGCRVAGVPAADGQPVRVRVWRESGRAGLPELWLQPGDGGWWDDRFAISLAANADAAVSIRALGPTGWAELKRRVPVLATWRDLPNGAAATLPAVWRGTALLTAPWFDQRPNTLPFDLPNGFVDAWSAVYGMRSTLCRMSFCPIAGRGF